MSKESVNRTLAVPAVLLALLTGAPAEAQVALVVGSVRDERGAPIDGATISGRSAAGPVSATTAADGTFALRGESVANVTVTCRYCLRSSFAVTEGQPVVAIVRRFAALADRTPSTEDLERLPYAHVESALALQPFVLLRQSSGFYPGSQVSDRGLLPADALLIDDGVPNYDVVFGASPYATIPSHYESSAAMLPAADAYRYGDRAGSGTAALDSFGGDDAAFYGSDSTLRLEDGGDDARVVAGTSSNWQESRQRVDGSLLVPLSADDRLTLSGGTAQGYEFVPAQNRSAGNFSYANGAFSGTLPALELYADAAYDRGDYVDEIYGAPLTDVWSDAQLSAGFRTRGTVQFFADAADRLSTGIYDPQALGGARIGATLAQNRFDAGVTASGADYAATAAVGFFGFTFNGGTGGVAVPSAGRLATPSLQLTLFPQAKWSGTVEASSSFDLPTLWDQYGFNDNYGTTSYDRAALYAATLTYSDDARLRVSLEEAWQDIHGFENGQVNSGGASVVWQIAPALALRSWTMLVSNGTVPSGQAPYEPMGAQPSVDAFWLTYQNRDALRVDAIYRKDVLDWAPFYHFDGDLSGPLGPGSPLRWYVGVEDRLRSTHVNAGFQLGR